MVPLAANSKSLQIHLPCADISSTSTDAFPFHPNSYIPSPGPMVQFNSPCPLFPQTHLSVFIRGCSVPIYTEASTLLCTSSPIGAAGQWMYTTPFVPGYWNILSNCADPTKYYVEQLIVPLCLFPSAINSGAPAATNGPASEITVYYQFSGYQSSGEPAPCLQDPNSSLCMPRDSLGYDAFTTLSEPYRQTNHLTHELLGLRNSVPFDFPGTGVQSDGPPVQLTNQEFLPS